MKRLKRTAAGLAAAVAAAGSLVVPHPATASTVDGTTVAGPASRTVTLLTGDRVTTLDDGLFSVEPGDGRKGITFLTRRIGGQLSVVPSDAARLVGAGRLDPRLFDVTALLAYGYDDSRAGLPLVVLRGTPEAAVPTAGAVVDRQSPRPGGVAMRLDRARPGALWRSLTSGAGLGRTLSPGVAKVWLGGVREPAPRPGAPAAADEPVETYELRLRYIGRSGTPGDGFGVDVVSWDGTRSYFSFTDASTATIRVPKGRYILFGTLFGYRSAPTMTFVTQPVLDVTADRTVTMDERLAKPNTVTVPRRSATQVHAHVGLTLLTPGEPVIAGQYGTTFDDLYTLQLGDDAPGDALVSHLTGVWAEVGADGTTSRSPYSYSFSHYEPRGMVSGYRRTLAERELAAVRLTTAGGDDGLEGWWWANSRLAGRADQNRYETLIMPLPVGQPSTVTRYFSTDGAVRWQSGLRQLDEDDGYRGPYLFGAWTGYEPGRGNDESWNQAVFGPAFPTADDRSTGVTRLADRVIVDLPIFGDGAGRVANESSAGTTTLFRDGVEIGTGDAAGKGEFTVPPGDAPFRLEVNARRDPHYRLSTTVRAAWEFRSGHVGGDRAAALPLWTVRFSPRLDEHHTAPSGTGFTVPVVAVPAPGAATGRPRDLTVDVSYDDGGTWSSARLRGGKAFLRHPRGSGFVSLRATAKDAGGNSVHQTIIRAYRYGKAR